MIVNILSNDVHRFDDSAFIFLNFVWILPILFFVVFVILWRQFGVTTLAGALICILIFTFQIGIGRVFTFLRKRSTVLTDERVKLMSEFINGIRVIKLCSWEDFFRSQINRMRNLELRWLQCNVLTNLLTRTPYYWVSKLITFVMLTIVYNFDQLRFSEVMNLWSLFVLIGFSSFMCQATGYFIPTLVSTGAEVKVSIQRLQKILLLPELQANQKYSKEGNINSQSLVRCSGATHTEKTPLLKSSNYNALNDIEEQGYEKFNQQFENEKPSLVVENLSASWNQFENCSQNFSLRNLTFSVTGNEFVVIVGPVGAGKTSLLMALLGELKLGSGKAYIHGKLGYVSQQSWIFGETLRNNILCGQPFEENRYQKALDCAALSLDLTMLRSGDQTLVGERGVVLSGGQRARVSLARAIYQNADIYLLDDPFSAVDAKVGHILFHRCIMGALSNKPRILVTHNLEFASQADRILIIKNGCITLQGTYEELKKTGVDFIPLVRKKDNVDVNYLNDHFNKISTEKFDVSVSAKIDNSESSLLTNNFKEEEQDLEETFTGKITWKTYANYILAGGHSIFYFVLFVVYCVTQALYFFPDWWLIKWSNNLASKNSSEIFNCSQTTDFQSLLLNITSSIFSITSCNYLWIYTAALLCLLIAPVIRSLIFAALNYRASKCLHDRMFSRLLSVPVLFYDTNPAGRVLNRFSNDIGVVDFMLPLNIGDFLHSFFLVLRNLLVVTVINYWIIIPIVPLFVILIYLCNYYLSTSRALKRIESTSRSPILSHVNNTFLGLATLRAMHHETQFTNQFFHFLDQNTRANILCCSCPRWLGLRLDFVCSILTTCVAFISLLMVGQLNIGLVGLSLIYSLDLLDMFQWCVRQGMEIETQMVAVERILEYTELEQEENTISPVGLPEDWPPFGALAFQNVSFRYSVEQPLVLHQISFKINPMEKIGIVGRTGSGKSSLIAALFRLAEIESDGGSILVDDISTRNLSLKTLRSKLSVIPQDPVLFSGTIRLNLDPFEKFDDAQIWQALEEVQLKKTVEVLDGGLYHNVVENGQNFSIGQRQLLCFARALLCRNRFLIIDEATANVDLHTDSLIQITLRNRFAQCTVLIIAHRLHTVMDCDRLLVLDKGRVVQFDRPRRLLELNSGHFYDLVQSLGSTDGFTEIVNHGQIL